MSPEKKKLTTTGQFLNHETDFTEECRENRITVFILAYPNIYSRPYKALLRRYHSNMEVIIA